MNPSRIHYPPTLRSRVTACESFQSPPFFPSLVSLLSSPIFTLSPTPGILGEGAGGGWDTHYHVRAPLPPPRLKRHLSHGVSKEWARGSPDGPRRV